MAAEERLSIYVTRACPGCATARRVADEVRRVRPDVRVELLELDDAGPPPPPVFAVPTYLWGERVVSLGNPYLPDLLARLDGGDPGDDAG